jgi:hypothetical protein
VVRLYVPSADDRISTVSILNATDMPCRTWMSGHSRGLAGWVVAYCREERSREETEETYPHGGGNDIRDAGCMLDQKCEAHSYAKQPDKAR